MTLEPRQLAAPSTPESSGKHQPVEWARIRRDKESVGGITIRQFQPQGAVSPLLADIKGYGLAFAIQALGLLAGAAIRRGLVQDYG
jgi:hypothetical protein